MSGKQQSVVITEREYEQIWLLSDAELYPQAVEFMRGVGRPLPSTQINGLLNISYENTFQQLIEFAEVQQRRTTWKDQNVPDFYKRFAQRLKQMDSYVLSIVKEGQKKPTSEHMQVIKMEIVREFIQHLLAENSYMANEQAEARNMAQQERSARANREYRGPAKAQERRQG